MTGDAPTDSVADAGAAEHTGHDGSTANRWTPDALVAVRERPNRRRAVLVATAAVGIWLAWIHWLGLFAAGGLVGLVSEDLPRAVVAGLAVGGLVLAVHVLAMPAVEAGEFLALTPPSYVTVATALLVPLWGSLVRGVV